MYCSCENVNRAYAVTGCDFGIHVCNQYLYCIQVLTLVNFYILWAYIMLSDRILFSINIKELAYNFYYKKGKFYINRCYTYYKVFWLRMKINLFCNTTY